MKKIVIAIVAVFAMSTAASAQIQDLGVRFNAGTGYGAELSAMWGMGGNRLETDLGWSTGDHHTAFSLTGIYQWNGEFGSGFGWFAGVGAYLGVWSWEDGWGNNDSDFSLAVMGQVGLEYNFSAIPFQITLDWRPGFQILPETDPIYSAFALGIRYRF